MFVYLTLVGLFFLCWLFFFLSRKDLRTEMLVSSIVVWLFAFFDYLAQPQYWHPPTFFSIPIGIEGFLFAFCFSGIAAVIYEEIAGKRLRKIREQNATKIIHWLIAVFILFASLIGSFLFHINIMLTLVPLLAVGAVLIGLTRPDLRLPMIYSGLTFGLLYGLLFFLWMTIFPTSQQWWNLEIFWWLTIGGVPLGEVLFGFAFGAFWGPLYEFLFGYRLVRNRT
ncbi:MAG: lycopene cyclase domain-containing protein [bacterium]|nr:lycopene cyclase domain-containing protein [bacterium]